MVRVSSQRGFTLVEMMLVAAIAGLLVAVLPKALSQMSHFFWTSTAEMEIQRNSRNAIDIISKRLRNARADSILVDRMDSSQPYCSSIQFTPVGETTTVTFRQNGSWLEVVELSPAVTRRLVPNIGELFFFYPDAGNPSLIHVRVVAEKSGGPSIRAIKSVTDAIRIMN